MHNPDNPRIQYDAHSDSPLFKCIEFLKNKVDQSQNQDDDQNDDVWVNHVISAKSIDATCAAYVICASIVIVQLLNFKVTQVSTQVCHQLLRQLACTPWTGVSCRNWPEFCHLCPDVSIIVPCC